MIRPNIAPRRITTNATAGLFSAARSSIRGTPTNTQSIIRSSPDLTRNQKFGINYVDFFGSKKNSKILEKSMKTIRDSIVSTFSIASTLAKAMKGKTGVFGLVAKILGGASALAGGLGLIATPIIKALLGIVAVGGIGALLFTFRKDIAKFISDKASGVRNIIGELVSDFVGDRLGTGEDRDVRDQSRADINAAATKFQRKGLSEIDAREQAIAENIASLEERRNKLEEDIPSGSDKETNAVLRQKDALDRRINFLKTGVQEVSLRPGLQFDGMNIPFITDLTKNLFSVENFARNRLARSFLDEDKPFFPADLENLEEDKRKEAIQQTIKTFSQKNDLGTLRRIFSEAAEGKGVTAEQALFAEDVLKELGNPQRINEEGKKVDFIKELDSVKGLQKKVNKVNDDKSVNLSSNSNSGGNKLAMLPMNTGSNGGLTRDDRRVASGSSPTHKILDPFDRDNMFNVINRNSLGIIG